MDARHGSHGIIPARAGFTKEIVKRANANKDHPRSRGVYSMYSGEVRVSRGSSPLARGLLIHGHRIVVLPRIIPARAGFTHEFRGIFGWKKDHPRSRGVYRPRFPCRPRRRGSSPLARGLQTEPPGRRAQDRIIPARAGFTRSSFFRGPSGADHPRSRGVYARKALIMLTRSGSSPLARGLRALWNEHYDVEGIIPARAGFTHPYSRNIVLRGDHPRSRGVYTIDSFMPIRIRGSSPLARGLRAHHSQARIRGGIIPARAGFTDSGIAVAPINRDHPRSRGVYYGGFTRRVGSVGSSPLARGLLGRLVKSGDLIRIIPARAGFTALRTAYSGPGRDHPRSRGVYTQADFLPSSPRGSSPLARGLLGEYTAELREIGIIPARAGFTLPMSRPSATVRDHPRSRGVYALLCPSWTGSHGSSPLARGLRRRFHVVRQFLRIIPARAGFTPPAPRQ